MLHKHRFYYHKYAINCTIQARFMESRFNNNLNLKYDEQNQVNNCWTTIESCTWLYQYHSKKQKPEDIAGIYCPHTSAHADQEYGKLRSHAISIQLAYFRDINIQGLTWHNVKEMDINGMLNHCFMASFDVIRNVLYYRSIQYEDKDAI